MLEFLSQYQLHLSLAFLFGVILQCWSMLRRKPPIWSYIIFFGMIAYMLGFIIYSAIEYPWADFYRTLIPLLMTFGGIFALTFIIVFFKQIMVPEMLNEYVLFSLTISFWFLFFNELLTLPSLIVKILTVAGVIGTVSVVHIAYSKKAIPGFIKPILTAWYLIINFFLAAVMFLRFPTEFFTSGGLVSTGVETILMMPTLGMVFVYLAFNAGVIYFTLVVVFYIRDKEIVRNMINFSKTLLDKSQLNKKEILTIIIIQVVSFVIFKISYSFIGFYLLALWIMLTPIIITLIHRVYKKFTK